MTNSRPSEFSAKRPRGSASARGSQAGRSFPLAAFALAGCLAVTGLGQPELAGRGPAFSGAPSSAAGEPSPERAADTSPYLRLRDSSLTYHGPELELTNLTEFRIGWFGPTNLDDPLTGDLWWTASFAVQAANAASTTSTNATTGPVQLPFRLVPCWSANPWGSGVAQLARMVYTEQPLALIGSVDSAATHLAEQIVAKANLPLISPTATDPSVTLAGVPWMFSCAPSDVAVARALVNALLAALPDPQGRFAVVSTTDHESRMTTREVLRECARRQRPPEFHFELAPGTADFMVSLDALAKADPAAVLMIAGTEDSARLTRAVRGWTASGADRGAAPRRPLLFGGPAMSRARFRELVGAAGEGVQFPALVVLQPADRAAADFVEQFERERHHAPDAAALLTYDAVRLVTQAVRQAGPNRTALRSALVHSSPWTGISGTIRFDGTGQNARTNVPMARLHDGALKITDDDLLSPTVNHLASP